MKVGRPSLAEDVERVAAVRQVEEPLLADATWAYAQLRRAVDVAIALGENAHTVHRFRDLLDAGA